MNSILLRNYCGIIAICFSLFLNETKAQTAYSSFAAPTYGTNYSVANTGACSGCLATNLSNTANLSLTDSGRVILTPGASNSVTVRLSLNAKANTELGFVVKPENFNLNNSHLSAITISTYFDGVLVESFSGSNALSIDPISGKKVSIQANPSREFDEASISIRYLPGVFWDVNIFYARASYDEIPVPKVTEFAVQKNENASIVLKWKYTSQNGSYNSLMHSTNGKDYAPIYESNMQNSVEIAQDSFVHYYSTVGDHYYFVNSYDIDGNVKRSEIKQVTVQPASAGEDLFPNPAVNMINFYAVPGQNIIRILGQTGEVVLKTMVQNKDGFGQINISELMPGTYILEANADYFITERKKFVKL